MTKPLTRCPCGRTVKRKGGKVCAVCRADPYLLQKASYELSKRRQAARIEAEAEEQTAALPQKETYTPMMGEYAVWKMQRGEW